VQGSFAAPLLLAVSILLLGSADHFQFHLQKDPSASQLPSSTHLLQNMSHGLFSQVFSSVNDSGLPSSDGTLVISSPSVQSDQILFIQY